MSDAGGFWAAFSFLTESPVGKGEAVNDLLAIKGVTTNLYTVQEMRTEKGNPLGFESSPKYVVRIESQNRAIVHSAVEMLSHRCGSVLEGVTQEQRYTTRQQDDELIKVSAKPYPASGNITAVMIPIAKTMSWWSSPHSDRQQYFIPGMPGVMVRGHTWIGIEYADRIFRRLYHCRNFHPPAAQGFDFLTYFEFPSEQADDFRALLSELRDPRENPEWNFVDREFEVWMTKTGLLSA